MTDYRDDTTPGRFVDAEDEVLRADALAGHTQPDPIGAGIAARLNADPAFREAASRCYCTVPDGTPEGRRLTSEEADAWLARYIERTP